MVSNIKREKTTYHNTHNKTQKKILKTIKIMIVTKMKMEWFKIKILKYKYRKIMKVNNRKTNKVNLKILSQFKLKINKKMIQLKSKKQDLNSLSH